MLKLLSVKSLYAYSALQQIGTLSQDKSHQLFLLTILRERRSNDRWPISFITVYRIAFDWIFLGTYQARTRYETWRVKEMQIFRKARL